MKEGDQTGSPIYKGLRIT